MARKIAITNQKGGVGKTTVALNLAAGLTLRNRRVLLCDLDAQGNASAALGLLLDGSARTIKDLLRGEGKAADYIVATPQTDLLPAHNALKDIERDLLRDTTCGRLKAILKGIEKDYDFILLDCPPSINVFTRNALVAADEVLVPVDVGGFAVLGLNQLLEEIEALRKKLNPGLALLGVLVCKVDRRTTLADQLLQVLRRDLSERLLTTVIRTNVDIVKAQIAQQSIFAFHAKSPGAEDFLALTEEVLYGREKKG